MTKIIAFLVFALLLVNEIPEYIVDYHNISTKAQELNFIEQYKNSKNVSIKAYVISLEMKQAEYKISPFSKLSIFKKGKKKLEKLILEYPNNVDLRYVRLLIQEKSPSILNYNSNIEADKHFLKAYMLKEDDSDYLDSYIIKNTSL
ncbi:hypothetical protein UJ101_02155 [Flavobacteriaceae bacterium UJ101]|nr:hypothetical protein UJ101_02155 [Flavobacteriaceae bacterium UJ101]